MRESKLVCFFDNTLWRELLESLIYVSLEWAPYRKAGSYWLREVGQSVIGGHWGSLIRLIRLIRLIGEAIFTAIYGDGMGWDWVGWDGLFS